MTSITRPPAPALSLLRAARSRQAIGIASAKWIGTGAKMRLTDVYDRGRQQAGEPPLRKVRFGGGQNIPYYQASAVPKFEALKEVLTL